MCLDCFNGEGVGVMLVFSCDLEASKVRLDKAEPNEAASVWGERATKPSN